MGTQLDASLYKLLFEAESSLAFDIAVTADTNARVHLAAYGRFSLGCLQIASMPSLEFGAAPRLLSVKLAPSLHALTVILQTSERANALLPDGTRQEHAPGTLLLAFRTGQLTRMRLEIRCLALSFMQCEALAARARLGLETCQRLWTDAASPLHAKFTALRTELARADRPGNVCEELIMLLANGIPPSCVHAFILRDLREADLTRILKSISVASNALLQTLITQVRMARERAPPGSASASAASSMVGGESLAAESCAPVVHGESLAQLTPSAPGLGVPPHRSTQRSRSSCSASPTCTGSRGGPTISRRSGSKRRGCTPPSRRPSAYARRASCC